MVQWDISMYYFGYNFFISVLVSFCRILLLLWIRKVSAPVAMLKPYCSHFGGWLSERKREKNVDVSILLTGH